MIDSVSILGTKITRASEAAIEGEILKMLGRRGGAKIFTPNPQMLAIAERDEHFKRILGSASLLLPDGVGVLLAARLSGERLPQRITGIDTAYRILELSAQRSLKIAFIGGEKGVAAQAAGRLKKDIPMLDTVLTHHGYFNKSRASNENLALIEDIRKSAPDVLFVCFGTPAQERWIHENASSLPSVRIFMGLGGALDVWSGKVRRAPRAVQLANAEWLWRCIGEPRRFLRLTSLPSLYSKIIWESIKNNKKL